MDLAELRGRIEKRLDDAGVVSSYTDGDILAVINEGLRLFALLTLCVERTVVIKLQPDTPLYQILDLLPNWLLPLRARCHVLVSPPAAALWDVPIWEEVLFDELSPEAEITMTQVKPVRLHEIAQLSDQWTLDRDATVKRYGCLGLDLLFVHPTPSVNGTSLQLTYAAAPEPLATGGDIPAIPSEDHQALVHYAVATLPINYGGREFQQGTQEFVRFLDLAQHRAEQVRTRARACSYDNMPFELVGYDRSILAALAKGKKEREKQAA